MAFGAPEAVRFRGAGACKGEAVTVTLPSSGTDEGVQELLQAVGPPRQAARLNGPPKTVKRVRNA